MPFGLKNTSQSFQQLMDCTFADQPCIFVYLDDNLAAITTPEEHLQVLHLHQVFQLLKDNGLVLNLQKCEFFQESISFLGHKVHSGGVEPPSAHVDAITCLPPPLTPKELQWFLGMINSYRRFLPAAARTLCPLTEALKGNPKVFCWTTEMQATADAIRVALAAAVPLSHPLPTAELSLATDASAATLAVSSNNGRLELGGLLVFSLGSCLKQSASSLLSTGCFWLPSTPSGILGSCWRATISSSGRTISCSWRPSTACYSGGHCGNSGSWRSSPSAPATSSTSQGFPTWLRTTCLDHQRHRCARWPPNSLWPLLHARWQLLSLMLSQSLPQHHWWSTMPPWQLPSSPTHWWLPYVRPVAFLLSRGTWRATLC